MKNKKILEYIKNFPNNEKRNLSYDEIVHIMNILNTDEIVELSNIIGYPVFTRLCMGTLKHKFVLLQDGASAIIVNDKKQILLQQRVDNDKWGLPGGCQELGERFEDVVIREVKEETNLDVKEVDLKLISVVSGMGRKRQYPNGDIVINNSAVYLIEKYSGELKWDDESKIMKFFDIDNLPTNQHDEDLVNAYIEYLNNKI